MDRTIPVILFLIASLPSSGQESRYPPLTQEEIARIDAATPKRARAKPKKPRKMLVSNLAMRDGRVVRGHPSIPHGNYAIEQMGKRTGAYEVVFSDDIEMFRPGVIDQFDAICFNNTVGVLFDDPELRESLLGFIAKGKGWVGFHAAAATFVQYPRYDQWPAFGRMVGGTENGGHPWKPDEPITIKVDDVAHPLNAAFRGESFEIADEVYQLQEPELRDRLRVLLSIDIGKTDVGPNRRILPIRRADMDFPMTWIKPHEKGRVFYSSLGHNPHVFWHPRLLDHFLAGIQYALGDLEVDDTPSGRIPATADDLPAEARQRIDAFLPDAAPAQPQKPRRILVSNLNVRKGQVRRGELEHPSIPYGNYAVQQLGKRTGAYEVVFSNDIQMFRPGVLDQFDAVCFLNTVGVLFDDPELRNSLLRFVSGGKGFIGFHAAAATFVEYPVYGHWPEFSEMVGGTENGGHPWGTDEVVTIKIDDPSSPLNAAFEGQSFEIADEMYQFQEPDLRGRLRVLLSIDISKTDTDSSRRILRVRMDDKDFPMSWIRRYGEGRIFYTSLGHSERIFRHPKLLRHFLAGIQYTLGDLPADDTPSAKLQLRAGP